MPVRAADSIFASRESWVKTCEEFKAWQGVYRETTRNLQIEYAPKNEIDLVRNWGTTSCSNLYQANRIPIDGIKICSLRFPDTECIEFIAKNSSVIPSQVCLHNLAGEQSNIFGAKQCLMKTAIPGAKYSSNSAILCHFSKAFLAANSKSEFVGPGGTSSANQNLTVRCLESIANSQFKSDDLLKCAVLSELERIPCLNELPKKPIQNLRFPKTKPTPAYN